MSHVYLHIEIPEELEVSVIVHKTGRFKDFGRIYTKETANAELSGWHTRFRIEPEEGLKYE